MKYVVMVDTGNGPSEVAVRAAAETDWSEYSITKVKPA